jgi:hypothetical protein
MSERSLNGNPYPGLRPFSFADRELFFGREKQSEELLRKLRRNRFLAVVGTSGSGKSSLVRAGLLPLIDKGLNAGVDSTWTVARFRPGKNPIYNMAAALTTPVHLNSFGQKINDQSSETDQDQLKTTVIETSLRRSAVGLADHFKRSQTTGQENFLLFIDQFEELFRFKEQSERSHPEDEAAAFVKLLLEAAYNNSVAVYVLLTMRSDFLGDCAQFRDLPQAINDGQYLIPRMTRDEQRTAITQPAARLGGEMTPRLVQRLLNDAGDNPDHLPLLQHALMRIWDRWRDEHSEGLIDLSQYKAIGTLDKALSNHAQETYDSLTDPHHQKIAERLFKALTETAVNNREVRRPAELREICEIAKADVKPVSAVINHFRAPGRSFLMPPPDRSLSSDTIIDISHESLIRGWDLLKQWVEEEARSKAIYQRLADGGNRRYNTDEGASLWRDPDLKFALDWRKREDPNEVWAKRYDAHYKEAIDFLEESARERQRELDAEETRLRNEREREERERQRELDDAQAEALAQQRIAEAERSRAEEAHKREVAERENADIERSRAAEQARFARRLQVAVAALIVMFLLASGFAIYAFSQKGRADNASAQLKTELTRSEGLRQDLGINLDASEKLRQQAEDEKQKAEKARVDAVEATKTAEAEKQHAQTEKLNADRARNDAVIASQHAAAATLQAQRQATTLQTTLDQLELAEKDKEATREVLKLERDGLVSLEKNEPAQAIRNFQKLQNRYQNDATEEGAKALSWALYNFGTAQRQAKNYEQASVAYNAALEKQLAIYGRTNLEIAPALERLAQVRHEQGEYKLSEAAYESLRDILEVAGERVTADRIVNVKRDQARLFHDQARDARTAIPEVSADLRAEEQKVFKFSRGNANAKLSPDEQEELDKAKARVVQLTARLEELHKVVDTKYKEAESLYQEVVTARESLFPQIHADLIDAYNTLASFYQDKVQLYKSEREMRESKAAQTEADKLYELARLIRENKITPGKNESEKIDVLVEAYTKQKRWVPVTALLLRKLELEKEAGGPFVETLMDLVTNLYRQGQDSKAQPYLEQVFSRLHSSAESGKNNDLEDVIVSAYSLLDALMESKKIPETEKLFQYLTKILDDEVAAATGENDKRDILFNKILLIDATGRMWFRMENYSKAEQLWNSLAEITKRDYGTSGDWQVWSSTGLAMLYLKQGRDGDALPLFLRLQKLYERGYGPRARSLSGKESRLEIEIRQGYSLILSPNEYLVVLSNLAILHVTRGDNKRAEETYTELEAASKWMVEHPELDYWGDDEQGKQEIKEKYESWRADALEQYAGFLNKIGKKDEASRFFYEAQRIRSWVGPSKGDMFGWLTRP